MPIEFARISKDGRLTLVIKKDTGEVKTLYAISRYHILEEAINDLAKREGCNINKIGYYDCQAKQVYPLGFPFSNNISNWLKDKNIDAVLWTNLDSNFKDKLDAELTSENVISYLKRLHGLTLQRAEEYIRKAPAVVHTHIRDAIVKQLNWQ